jgi:hypothetical protein
MKTQQSVFGWEHEPADEGPSEFSQSTGYSLLSGYHAPKALNARAARRSRGSGSGLGFKGIVAVFLVLLALSGWAVHEMAKWLR